MTLMVKQIIAPIQAWLLKNGQCVGCGTPLKFGDKKPSRLKGKTQVTCKCGRVFIKDAQGGYRRALLSEV